MINFYFHKMHKNELAELKTLKTASELCAWAEQHNYPVEQMSDTEKYFDISDLGEEIYNFGEYVDWAYDMQISNKSIFGNETLKEHYADNRPVVCSAADFLKVIEHYRQDIITYYKSLLTETEDIRKVIQKQQKHIEDQLGEWLRPPIDVDMTHTQICCSKFYEFAIFELVRLYKTFDWANDVLILLSS